jgi:predicted aspartyl protease
MYPYDSSESPPVALVQVEVANPVTGQRVLLVGKLDTGAAISVLPREAISRLGLTPQSDIWVAGYDAQFTQLPAYFISLRLADCLLDTVKVTASGRNQMLIGRDVLRHFIATFDGKNSMFDLRDP